MATDRQIAGEGAGLLVVERDQVARSLAQEPEVLKIGEDSSVKATRGQRPRRKRRLERSVNARSGTVRDVEDAPRRGGAGDRQRSSSRVF